MNHEETARLLSDGIEAMRRVFVQVGLKPPSTMLVDRDTGSALRTLTRPATPFRYDYQRQSTGDGYCCTVYGVEIYIKPKD